MISGLDHAYFGQLTSTVGAWFERLDDIGTQIGLFDPQDATGAFACWVGAGWALSEHWGEGWSLGGRQPLVAGPRDVIESAEAGHASPDRTTPRALGRHHNASRPWSI